MRQILMHILALCCSLQVMAQNITATVSRNQILIGDQIGLTLEVDAGRYNVEGIVLEGMGPEEAIEIVQPGEMQKDETTGKYIQEMVITSFDSGTHYVPEIGAILKLPNRYDTIFSRRIPITVQTIAPDSLGLAPVKPILLEEKKWTDYLIYALPVLLILLLAGAFWWWSRRKTQDLEEELDVPLDPPHIEALSALDELERKELWQNGQIKDYETEVSMIMRRYTERKFGFPAMEWTTREIGHYFSQPQWKEVPSVLLADILSMSDLVKYAKSDPGPEAHAAQIKKCEEFIRTTQNMMLEEE